MSRSNNRRLCQFMAVRFLRCGAAKPDTLAGIADMPPARRGLRYAGLWPISAINLAAEGDPDSAVKQRIWQPHRLGACYAASTALPGAGGPYEDLPSTARIHRRTRWRGHRLAAGNAGP